MSGDYMDICEQLSRENEQLRAQVAALEARLRDESVGYIGTDGTIRRTPPGDWKPLPLRTPAPVPAQPIDERLPPGAVIPTLDELREILKTEQQPVPAQPAALPLEIAADLRSDDYVSPRLRDELEIPPFLRRESPARTKLPCKRCGTGYAQPAVPEAVAKDAAHWNEWLPWMRRLDKKPFALAKLIREIDAAILSATDTEVKNGARN